MWLLGDGLAVSSYCGYDGLITTADSQSDRQTDKMRRTMPRVTR